MKTIEVMQDLEHARLRFKVSNSKPSSDRELEETGMIAAVWELAAALVGERSRYMCNRKHYSSLQIPGFNPAHWSLPTISTGDGFGYVTLEHSGRVPQPTTAADCRRNASWRKGIESGREVAEYLEEEWNR